MNRLPGDAAPVNPDEFPSASQFVLALERYAFSQRLPVREGVTVRSLGRSQAGTAISVATDDGAFEARTVVMASGGARVPRVPTAGAALSASVEQDKAAEASPPPQGKAPRRCGPHVLKRE